MKNKAIVIGIVAVFVCFTFIYKAFAQEQAQKAADNVDEDAFTVETVSGEVSGITKHYISIIYDRDYEAGTEEEALIPFDPNTAFKHKKSIDEIKRGDLISVEYEKPTENSKRKPRAKTINFIQSGVDNLVSEIVDNAVGQQE